MHERADQDLAKVTPNYEIIFVNDGSPDNSEAVPSWPPATRTVAITHTRNFVLAERLHQRHGRGHRDAVVLLDGDPCTRPS